MIDLNQNQLSGPAKPQSAKSGAPAMEMDAGSRSLADALRLSFNILKFIMIVLVGVFIASELFSVEPDEQAIVLRLGKIKGIGEERILEPGLHWAMAPFEEVVKIPVKKVQIMPIDSFWYYQDESEKLGQEYSPPATLNPIRDGYCLTRNDETVAGASGNDYNIVHCKWRLTYTISDPEEFFRNVYVKPTQRGQTYGDVLNESVSGLLRSLASGAIISNMVNYSIDEAILSKSEIAASVKKTLQEKLDRIGTGIKVESMQLTQTACPRQVNDAFVASIQASLESEKLKSQAKGYADNIINEAGGPVAYQIIGQLEKPTLSSQETEVLWSNLAGGAQELIANARAYRTSVVENARANADYLRNILPEYRKRPKLVLQKIYQDTIESVLDNADEKIIVQPSGAKDRQVRIQVNRDIRNKPKNP